MDTSGWTAFDGDGRFDYGADALKKKWKALHAGDLEPWPSDESLQEAWRRFHAGDFAGAVELGLEAGPEGHAVV
ncbi:MAG: hypothetical protein R3323_05500, partial [Wenzhouxiangellaceae bacterium]|nr:hypothetical protein [Wenzhouxiangellaceae bacterium]